MEMTCPKCHGRMRQFERNGVHIDQCTECRGIFLDRGELEHLIDAENRLNAPAAPPAGQPQAPTPPPPAPGYGQQYPQHAPPPPAPAYGYGQPHYKHGRAHYKHGHHGYGHKRKSIFRELFD